MMSQANLDLLRNPNPSEVLDREGFRPVWEQNRTTSQQNTTMAPSNFYNNGWLSSETDTADYTNPSLTSSPMQQLGKRKRNEETSSVERELKQLKIETKWHHKHIYDRSFQMMVDNPNFIPKYIADLIPIPMKDLNTIYNEMLLETERRVLEGTYEWITNYFETRHPRTKIAGWTQEGNSFRFAKVSDWVCSENYPFNRE